MNRYKYFIVLLFTIIIIVILQTCNIGDYLVDVNDTLLDDREEEPVVIPNYYKNILEAEADGVIGYWRMDETSGINVQDETGTNNGTANDTNIVSGQYGMARQFHDTDDTNHSKIDLPGIILLNGAFTISAWGIISDYSNSCGIGGNQVDYDDGRLSFSGGTNNIFTFWTSGANDITLSQNFPTDEWFYIVLVRDSSNNTYVYKNNIDVGNGTAVGNIQWNRIGNNPNLSSWRAWEGSLDDLAIWNRALTPQEISDIYNSGYSLVAD